MRITTEHVVATVFVMLIVVPCIGCPMAGAYPSGTPDPAGAA